jgi:hypothetical protein
MNLMKYIINENGPVLFPEKTFVQVAGEIQSSGYCSFWFSSETQRFECFTTPEPTATPNDYVIIENFLNG